MELLSTPGVGLFVKRAMELGVGMGVGMGVWMRLGDGCGDGCAEIIYFGHELATSSRFFMERGVGGT